MLERVLNSQHYGFNLLLKLYALGITQANYAVIRNYTIRKRRFISVKFDT